MDTITIERSDAKNESALDPDTFYPSNISIKRRYFGPGRSQFWVLVKKGLLPRPVHPYPGSQMSGHYGRTIIKFQREREAAAEKEAAAKADARAKAEARQRAKRTVPKSKQKRRATR